MKVKKTIRLNAHTANILQDMARINQRSLSNQVEMILQKFIDDNSMTKEIWQNRNQ